MFIILEGPDGAGKTTLARHVLDLLDAGGVKVECFHRGPPKEDPWTEYVVAVEWYKPGGGKHVLADRWHWGELVYGPIYRGGSGLNRVGRQMVDDFLLKRGAVIAYLYHDIHELARRCRAKGEDFIREEDLPMISISYDIEASASRVPVLALRDPGPTEAMQLVSVARILESCAAVRWSR